MNKRKVNLTDITLNITDGKHGDCENKEGSGYYFLSVKDLDGLFINYDKARQITAEDFFETDRRTKLEPGDTIYANSGDTIGKSLYIKDSPLVRKSTFQKSVAILKPNQDLVNSRYLYYLLKYETERLRKTAVGSAQKNLLLDDLRNFETSIHDMSEQIKISELLGIIDDKIELNIKMNRHLWKMADEIYEYYFIQFDFPKLNEPYKASGGEFNKENDFNMAVPLGWSVESLGNNSISKIIKPGVERFDNKFYLATGDVEKDNIVGGKYVSYENRETRANMEPIVNSIWFAKMKNSIKHLYFGDYSEQAIKSLILSTGFFGIEVVEEYFEYLIAYIHNSKFEEIKDKLAHGATQQSVNNDDLRYIPLIIPPIEVIKDFKNLVNPIYKKIYLTKQENVELEELRDFLLPLLMNGQVTIQ